MGSPKALLVYKGCTFLERIVDLVDRCPQIGDRLVVAGRHLHEISSASGSVPVVFNPDYALGMTTSFQTGISALPKATEGVIVFLVDHPAVSSQTVSTLLRHAGSADIVVPAYRGRRGHPVFFSNRVMAEIMRLRRDQGVNTLVRSDPARVREIQVEDPGILCDIDTPEDLERLLEGEWHTPPDGG